MFELYQKWCLPSYFVTAFVVEFKVAFERSIRLVLVLSLARRTFFGQPLSIITLGCIYFGMQEFEHQNQLSQILEKEYPFMTSDKIFGHFLT